MENKVLNGRFWRGVCSPSMCRHNLSAFMKKAASLSLGAHEAHFVLIEKGTHNLHGQGSQLQSCWK